MPLWYIWYAFVCPDDQAFMEKYSFLSAPTWSLFRPVCSTAAPPAPTCLPAVRPLFSLYGGLLGVHPGHPGVTFPHMAFNPLGLAAQSAALQQQHQQQQARELLFASPASSSSPSASSSAPSPPLREGVLSGEGSGECGPQYPPGMYRYHPYLLDKYKPPSAPKAVDSCRP